MADGGQQGFNRLWYNGSPLSWLLLPLTGLFWLLTRLRRGLFRTGILRSHAVTVPVVVIGNITVGGTGKTPVALWLVESLRERGVRVGVVSRGYGANVGAVPRMVAADSDVALVGDEPLLIARRGRCPVVVHPDRVAAARRVLDEGVDLIVADDGLQHYRLARDFEIALVDGQRGFGNGWLLPAGPLREPLKRLQGVQRLIVNGEGAALDLPVAEERVSRMHLRADNALCMATQESRPLAAFADVAVHAIAGIGNPERFFRLLESFGIRVLPHPLPDHATLTVADLTFDDDKMVFMTEKDAVKCTGLTLPDHWYVPVDVDMMNTDWLDEVAALVSQRPTA